MAESEESLSDESSDIFEATSPEYSTSSESNSEEATADNSATTSTWGKGKSNKKRSSSKATKATRPEAKKRRKQETAMLDRKEMEELSAWIFSAEQANNVEKRIRLTLVEDSRINCQSDRKSFAEHVLGVSQKQQFQLLVAGFCRKFSTLAKESFESSPKSCRKAAFSVAWMKFLSNFHPGKTTQERMILNGLLKEAKESFSPESVHCVISVLHESVYTIIHEHVRLKKAETSAETIGETAHHARHELTEESNDTLYRYCGAALHRMIKLRKETLAGKKGRGELSSQRKPIMEKELTILQELLMKDKSDITSSLKNLDEGNLIFPRAELIPFLRSVDNEVREFATDSNLRKYPSKFLTMCQNTVLNNENLELDFRLLVASLVTFKSDSDLEIVDGLFQALVSKLANTRINEFMNARIERELKDQGKVVDADEMLRPRLKAYALATKRK